MYEIFASNFLEACETVIFILRILYCRPKMLNICCIFMRLGLWLYCHLQVV